MKFGDKISSGCSENVKHFWGDTFYAAPCTLQFFSALCKNKFCISFIWNTF